MSIVGTRPIVPPAAEVAPFSKRVEASTRSRESLIDLFSEGDDLFFVFPETGGADKIGGIEGVLAGTWASAPALVTSGLAGVPWAKGAGNTIGYRAATTASDVVAGGADFVTRALLMWTEGAIASFRQLMGNSVSGGAVNTSGIVYFNNATEIVYAHQYGSKTNTNVVFTMPFTLADDALVMPSIAQVDNGDGTQTVSCWINGARCAVASVLNGTDNGDDTATIQDGAPNGVTQYCWLSILFSTSISAYGRFAQIAMGTTDDAREAALALELFGVVGDSMVPAPED